MSIREVKFVLVNFADQEKKVFVTRDRTMNEAISKAYIKVHGLRKNGRDNWQIVSATDSFATQL